MDFATVAPIVSGNIYDVFVDRGVPGCLPKPSVFTREFPLLSHCPRQVLDTPVSSPMLLRFGIFPIYLDAECSVVCAYCWVPNTFQWLTLQKDHLHVIRN